MEFMSRCMGQGQGDQKSLRKLKFGLAWIYLEKTIEHQGNEAKNLPHSSPIKAVHEADPR